MSSRIKILVVEDSFVKRELLKNILQSEPSFEVVKMFGTGESAINYIKSNDVNIITMDINLPGIDGFDTARRILAIKKIPIVIISSIRDKSNEQVLLKAMRENGALAFLDSPPAIGTENFDRATRKIIATIKTLSDSTPTTQLSCHADVSSMTVIRTKFNFANTKIIVMGISTGGPIVLEQILSSLPADFQIPIVIVQHILKGFEDLLIKTLDKVSKIKIKLVEDKEVLKKGTAYIAPSNKKISINRFGVISLVEVSDDSLILDTVSHLFASAATAFGDQAVGVLLTGMGRDGAKELKLLRNIGAYTIAQDKESSAIFGMPGEAVRLDAAVDIFPPNQIAQRLIQISDAVKSTSK